MKVDNAQLAAFAAVMREGTFELAARKLNVSASAISQRIKLLEDRLGQVLIQRTTPCQPSAAGRILLRYAEEVALLEAEMLAGLGVQADGVSLAPVRIPIVLNADSLDSWFIEVFKAVAADGSLALDIRTEDQDHSVALLREGAVMAGVGSSAEAIQGCRVEPLGVMRYLAVASPSFIGRYFAAGVNAQTLAVAPMLRFNRKDGLQGVFIAQWTAQDIRPPVHMVPSTHAFFEAVRADLAWGMIPEQLAGAGLSAGTLQPLVAHHGLDVPLYWHRWRIGSQALDTLSGMVQRAARQALRP